MKNRSLALVGAVLLASAPLTATAQQKCVDRMIVSDVSAGNVPGTLGAYDGNAVYFTANSRSYALFEWSNLGTDRGVAMFKTLLVAMAGKFKVTAWDHHPPYCDDVDEVWIHAD